MSCTREFPTARQVNAKTPVRVQGVERRQGRVRPLRQRRARSPTSRSASPTTTSRLHADASAALRWRTVLGGRMELALDPGSASAPPLAGRPITRTRIQTELEDVTRTLRRRRHARHARAPARAAPARSAGRRRRPRDRRARPQARCARSRPPRVRCAASATDDLRARSSPAAPAWLRGMDRAGADSRRIRDAAPSRRCARPPTPRRAGRHVLPRAPGALDATTRVAGTIDATLPALDALVADLRPGARRLGPALLAHAPDDRRTCVDVLGDARPLAAPAAARVSTPRRRLAASGGDCSRRSTRRSAGCSDDLVPYLESTDDDVKLPVYQLIGPTFSSLGGDGRPVTTTPATSSTSRSSRPRTR